MTGSETATFVVSQDRVRAEYAIRGALIALGVDAHPVILRMFVLDHAPTLTHAMAAIKAARDASDGDRVSAMRRALDRVNGVE